MMHSEKGTNEYLFIGGCVDGTYQWVPDYAQEWEIMEPQSLITAAAEDQSRTARMSKQMYTRHSFTAEGHVWYLYAPRGWNIGRVMQRLIKGYNP